MTLFMNEKDMNEMLDSICPEGETYQGKAWGTLMSGTAEMLALGALSNVYCYVGVTEKTLVIAVLETFDISHIYGKICIPFDQFDELKVQKGLPECFSDGRGTGRLAGQLSHRMGPVHRKAVRVHGFYRQAVSEPCRHHPALGQRGREESGPAHPQPGLQRKGG